MSAQRIDTDVLVVGGGPGGAAAGYYLARHGIDVTVVDKATFPREKVCGDGLTPRASPPCCRWASIPTIPGSSGSWACASTRVDTTIELPWPELTVLAGLRPRHAARGLRLDPRSSAPQKAGARLVERTEAVEPIIDDGWVAGATVRPAEDRDAPSRREIRARFVIAADGAASRFAKPAGVRRDDSRPLGIAARRYYRTDYHPGPWFESWLDLWEGDLLLPGYGWLFPVAGGRINLGAGLLNTFKNFKEVSAQRLFDAFAAMLPAEWAIIDEETADGRVLSGPLPMSFNRVPQAVPGLLLIGDAAGAVNPFNGEGIAYAMETAEIAAELCTRRS